MPACGHYVHLNSFVRQGEVEKSAMITWYCPLNLRLNTCVRGRQNNQLTAVENASLREFTAQFVSDSAYLSSERSEFSSDEPQANWMSGTMDQIVFHSINPGLRLSPRIPLVSYSSERCSYQRKKNCI